MEVEEASEVEEVLEAEEEETGVEEEDFEEVEVVVSKMLKGFFSYIFNSGIVGNGNVS